MKLVLASNADVSEMLEQDRKQVSECPGSGEVEVQGFEHNSVGWPGRLLVGKGDQASETPRSKEVGQ